MGGGGAGPGAASPAGPCGDGGRTEWSRIYGCMAALLRKSQGQVEALLADRTRLEAFVKIQHEFWVARVGLLQAQLQQMRKAEASRRRCEAANLELLLGDKERELRCCQKLAELTEGDLEDFMTSLAALAAENTELKIKLKEVGSSAELSENTADHGHSARDLRAEIRKLKQAYKTLSSKKDKEVSALLAEKDFVWNQLRTMEQDYATFLKNKKIEAAQATNAAQKLQQNVEELQVATQKKDGEIGRLRANAVDAKKKISILEDKLQEMRSLAKKKDDEIEIPKDGQPETSQKRKKYINDTHRKYRSEGPALREKSKNTSRRQMVDEDEQPETSQKRNCTSSLSNEIDRGNGWSGFHGPNIVIIHPIIQLFTIHPSRCSTAVHLLCELMMLAQLGWQQWQWRLNFMTVMPFLLWPVSVCFKPNSTPNITMIDIIMRLHLKLMTRVFDVVPQGCKGKPKCHLQFSRCCSPPISRFQS